MLLCLWSLAVAFLRLNLLELTLQLLSIFLRSAPYATVCHMSFLLSRVAGNAGARVSPLQTKSHPNTSP